jgi:hypothetical protein
MRTAAAALAALALSACAQSHTPTLAPAATPGVTAAVPAPPTARRGSEIRPLKHVALVEVKGPNIEAEAFVSRLLSEISDRELFQVTDARLSGASASLLAADPQGRDARAFREQFPVEAYMAADVAQCGLHTNRHVIPTQTPEGYRSETVTYTYEAECPVTLRLIDAEDGHQITSLDARGRASFNGDDESGGTPAEEDAARDAATRIAKKLKSAVGR